MQLQALLTASLLLLLFWKKDGISSAAEPGYLDFDNLPETNFSCESKVIGGYYADVETGCQMFHVCTIGQKGEITDIKFLCLNGTVFDQETRVCERLDEVDCSKTESFFDLNLQLYGNKAGPFGIEPENEEIVEEECDPEDEEECQRTEDGGVREEEEEEGGGRESVPSNNNNNNNGGVVIQQTTFTPISGTTTTTKRPPNLFPLSTSTARLPTSTLQPSTTGQPAFQSGDPDTIAALLALHNAFAQSLQHHDINNKQQQDHQQAQQQEQIEKQRQEIEEHQRKQHLQQIHQQKQQAQLQHQQAQLQHHQAQLHHQQQKIQQQHTKQAAAAYAAAVNSQAPQPATPKPSFQPLPPPPLPLPRPPQLSHQIPQPQQHRFPAQIQYEPPKHPSSTPRQDVPQQIPHVPQLPQAPQQSNHRFPPQIHYESSKHQNVPQQDSSQQNSHVPQQIPQQSPQRFPPQIHFEASKHPINSPQQERFGAFVQNQQNFGGQNVRLPVQSAERSKPFSFHQYESQPSTTASPYLLHQLKVNRLKQEQQHNNFPRQAQRSITTPAVAVVTSTSTTTSIRSAGSKTQPGAKGHGYTETFLGSSVTSSSSEVPANGTASGEYDEYQEGDVPTDPFFQDVPKIGRNRRDVTVIRSERETNERDFNENKKKNNLKMRRHSRNKNDDRNIKKYDSKRKEELKMLKKELEMKDKNDPSVEISRENVRSDLRGRGNLELNSNNGENWLENKKFYNKKETNLKKANNIEGIVVNGANTYNKKDKNVKVTNNSELTDTKRGKTQVGDSTEHKKLEQYSKLSSVSLENINIFKIRKLVKREAKYEQHDGEDGEDDDENDSNHVGGERIHNNRSKNVRKSSKSRRKSNRNRNKSRGSDKRDKSNEKGRRDRDRDVETDEEDGDSYEDEDDETVRRKDKVGSKIKMTTSTTRTTTTESPVDTTTKSVETSGVKNIPLDNNEFTDIIENVQRTISAKVVSIKQPFVYRNKEMKDNLQLSPEERKYYAEVSAVMSKYIPPATDNGDSSEEGESTPNMSERDKQRLSMFVTSKQRRKKNGMHVRNRRQTSKGNKKQYEVSEIVDEPTTEEPSARRLINQYRTSGIIPSQLISELIQRMDISSSREQTSRDAISDVKQQKSHNLQNLNHRTQAPIEGQVRNRALLPHRNQERPKVSSHMSQERNDPNTQSLRDVISNSGHHRMVVQKGSRSSLSDRNQNDEVNGPGRSSSSNGDESDSRNKEEFGVEQRVQPRKEILSTRDESEDYSLEKEESNPRPSRNDGEEKENKYAVSEEDVGDEKPSTNRPFLYQDQVGRANTGNERFSSLDQGSSVSNSRENFGDERFSNFNQGLSASVLRANNGGNRFSSLNQGSSTPISRANTGDERFTSYNRGSIASEGGASREGLSPDSDGRHQEASRTNVGSQDITRIRSRPASSQRHTTKLSPVEETSSELFSSSENVTPNPPRRRPTSRGRERTDEPVETSSESISTRNSGRRRPTSRGRENLKEEIPKEVVGRTRQPQRSRSRENLSPSVGSSDMRPRGRTAVVGGSDIFPDSSRLGPDSTRLISDSSRSGLDSTRLIPDSSRSGPDRSRSGPDRSRSVLESSRSVPENSRSVTTQSRRRPSNSEEEREKVEVNPQQLKPRENRISRGRRPTSIIPKEITTESTISDEKEKEEEIGETTESYDSRAKKLHSQLFPGENFSCEGKIKGGFYADIESDCRGFFICSQGEINGPLLKSHFWCGEATKFNQRSRTCQADYLVECSISTRYFGLNNDFAVPTIETNTFEPQKIS